MIPARRPRLRLPLPAVAALLFAATACSGSTDSPSDETPDMTTSPVEDVFDDTASDISDSDLHADTTTTSSDTQDTDTTPVTCPVGRAECDGDPATECETDLRTDDAHCGLCGNACEGAANASGICSNGSCVLQCDAGFGNCNGRVSDGCETSLNDDPEHCAACGNVCLVPDNGAAICTEGTCGVQCDSGFGDCDGDPETGCEILLADATDHCGTCDNACLPATNAGPICVESTCDIACDSGFGDCDSEAGNGCEVNLTSSVSHCGACGNACTPPANAFARCNDGMCGFECRPDFFDHDGDPANGCELKMARNTADESSLHGLGANDIALSAYDDITTPAFVSWTTPSTLSWRNWGPGVVGSITTYMNSAQVQGSRGPGFDPSIVAFNPWQFVPVLPIMGHIAAPLAATENYCTTNCGTSAIGRIVRTSPSETYEYHILLANGQGLKWYYVGNHHFSGETCKTTPDGSTEYLCHMDSVSLANVRALDVMHFAVASGTYILTAVVSDTGLSFRRLVTGPTTGSFTTVTLSNSPSQSNITNVAFLPPKGTTAPGLVVAFVSYGLGGWVTTTINVYRFTVGTTGPTGLVRENTFATQAPNALAQSIDELIALDGHNFVTRYTSPLGSGLRLYSSTPTLSRSSSIRGSLTAPFDSLVDDPRGNRILFREDGAWRVMDIEGLP